MQKVFAKQNSNFGGFQVQFSSARLTSNMFKVTDGNVEPMGRSSGTLDVQNFEEQKVHHSSRQSNKPLNPTGYM